MIELPNQFIEVSNYIPPNHIIIIDSFNLYESTRNTSTRIYCTKVVVDYGKWRIVVYAYEGNVVQISIKMYGIMFKTNTKKLLNG